MSIEDEIAVTIEDGSALIIDAPTIFTSLAASLADIEGVTETIDQIVSFAVESIGTTYGGISLVKSRGRSLVTVGATHPSVSETDRLQYELGEGPSMEAMADSTLVMSAHLATDERWPVWGPQASALGFNSVLSAKLHARGPTFNQIDSSRGKHLTSTRADLFTLRVL